MPRLVPAGKSPARFCVPASPVPMQLCAWCRRLPITSPLLLRPQLLPRVLRDCGWAAPRSRARRCVWLLSFVLPPVAAFPAMTLLPSMVAGSSFPTSDFVFSPTGSPRCPRTTRSPWNAWIAGKKDWRLEGVVVAGIKQLLRLLHAGPEGTASSTHTHACWDFLVQLLPSVVWRALRSLVSACGLPASYPLIGSKPRAGRNPGSEAKLYTGSECTVGTAVSMCWCDMHFCLCDLFHVWF